MGLFRLVWTLFETAVFGSVVVLSVDYYNPELIAWQVPQVLYQIAMVGVVGSPFFGQGYMCLPVVFSGWQILEY